MAYTPPAQTEGINGNSYEWHLDVASIPASGGEKTWLSCPDITALQPNPSPKTADGATYANRGQDSTTVIGETFTVTYDAKVVKTTGGQVAPYLQLLLDAAQAHLPGGDESKKVIAARVYHEWIPSLSWEFTCEVSWQRKNTGNAEVEFITFTLTSKGDRKVVANPATTATA